MLKNGGFMNVSRKLLTYFVLMQVWQISNTYTHMTDPIGIPTDITTQEDVHTKLTSQSPSIILLKMEPCPHCKALQPTFEKFSQHKKYRNIDFYIANGHKLQAARTIKQISNNKVNIP